MELFQLQQETDTLLRVGSLRKLADQKLSPQQQLKPRPTTPSTRTGQLTRLLLRLIRMAEQAEQINSITFMELTNSIPTLR